MLFMGHDHAHNTNNSNKALRVALFLNLSFFFVEVVGGVLSNSVAVLSDALHDLGDVLAIGLAWWLGKKALRAADSRYSFGYKRFSLLGALINSTVLASGSLFVIYHAALRIADPEPVISTYMMIMGVLGIAVNGYATWYLSGSESLNEKAVKLHLLEDVLGWAALLVAAIVMYFYPIYWLDGVLSIAIALWILYNAVLRLKEVLAIFLQAIPTNVDLPAIKSKIEALPQVLSMHHMHLWSLEGNEHVFSTHLRTQNISSLEEVTALKRTVRKVLNEYPQLSHYTIEIELEDDNCPLEAEDNDLHDEHQH